MSRALPSRRRLLLVVLGAAVLGMLLLVASWLRPAVASGGPVALDDAHVDTAYAFDGVVCLFPGRVGATVHAVEVEPSDGAATRLVQRPAGSPPTVAFPVADTDGASLVGLSLPGGEQDCSGRLLVVPDREGTVEVGEVRVVYAYGPGGLLRRTVSVDPEVSLQVIRTGPDPRLDA